MGCTCTTSSKMSIRPLRLGDHAVRLGTCDDGRTFIQRVDDIPGFATRPMQRHDFELKFRKNVVSRIGEAQTQEALKMFWTLEQQENVSRLCAPFSVL